MYTIWQGTHICDIKKTGVSGWISPIFQKQNQFNNWILKPQWRLYKLNGQSKCNSPITSLEWNNSRTKRLSRREQDTISSCPRTHWVTYTTCSRSFLLNISEKAPVSFPCDIFVEVTNASHWIRHTCIDTRSYFAKDLCSEGIHRLALDRQEMPHFQGRIAL